MENRRTKVLVYAAALALFLAALGALFWPQPEEGYSAFRTAVARAEAEAEAEKSTAGESAEEGEDTAEDALSEDKMAELKEKLSDKQYEVCFLKGTEAPFSGKFYKHEALGAYHCAVCQAELFKSDTKFDSGTGWPSFWDMSEDGAVEKVLDSSHGMLRYGVVCSNCKAHLGHVFEDGPKPSGLRYCINSLSLEFHGADGTIERATDEKTAADEEQPAE